MAVDWINVEGRLTAYFSGDVKLQEMLDNELTGGHKVHAITAGLLYNIDPADSRTHQVELQGNRVAAYTGGKRLRHAWHYGLKPPNMAKQFWISKAEAERIDGIMSDLHPGVVAWWKELGDEIFGVHSFMCPRCSGKQVIGGNCTGDCVSIRSRFIPQVKWVGWERHPARVLYTPFGRRRIYLGRRAQSMNALISQKPQSSGASMWYRRLADLHADEHAIEGTLVFTGSYGGLTVPSSTLTTVITGTYDSFMIQTVDKKVEDVIQWIAYVMEKAWPQLGGMRVPVDAKVGRNWMEKADGNPKGLDGVGYTPFSAVRMHR